MAREDGVRNSISIAVAVAGSLSVLVPVAVAVGREAIGISVLAPVAVAVDRETIGILGNGSQHRNVEFGKYFRRGPEGSICELEGEGHANADASRQKHAQQQHRPARV